MATLVVLAGRMIPTEEILKVSSRYLDWFSFYEFFFVKNPTNCPIIGLVPYNRAYSRPNQTRNYSWEKCPTRSWMKI